MKPSTTVSKLSRRLSYLVAAILVALPFHAFLTTWAGSNTGYIDIWRIWKEVLIVFILLPPSIWLAWHSKDIRRWLQTSWIVRLCGIYALLHLTLGGWAFVNDRVNIEALVYALGVNLRFLLFFLICLVIATHSGFLKEYWRKILVIPATAVLAFGILQKFILPYDFLRYFGYGESTIPAYQTVDNNIEHRRIQSFLRGANPLGSYLIIIITSFLIGIKKKKLHWWLITAASIVLLFFTYSRSGWLGTLIACLLLAGLTIKRSKKLYLLLGTTIIGAVFIAGLVYSFRDNDTAQNVLFHSSEESTSAQSSNATRLQSLENGVRDVAREPLGRGPGTAGPASFRNREPARISENYYLQIAQEVGIMGAAIFISINVLVALHLWGQRRDQLDLVLLVSFAGLTAVNLISHAWTDDTISLIWWGLAGVALAPAILKKSDKQQTKWLNLPKDEKNS